MKWWPFLKQQLFALVVVVWANGLLLRLTVRDSRQFLAPLYYATPWPMLMLLTAPLLWRFRRIPWAVFTTIAVAHIFLMMWIMEGWRSDDPSTERADLRVLQWNVGRPEWRLTRVANRIRGFDADIITVAEAFPIDVPKPEEWRRLFPGYVAECAPGEMLSLIRGEVISRESGKLQPGSYYALYHVRVRDREFRLLQVDVMGLPNASRQGPLQRIAAMTRQLSDKPLIVSGDFNTPRDSVHFRRLRADAINSFEKAGFGLGDTWPMPFPMLSLDQVWCNAGLIPVRCRNRLTILSDHRPVLAEFRFAPDGVAADKPLPKLPAGS